MSGVSGCFTTYVTGDALRIMLTNLISPETIGSMSFIFFLSKTVYAYFHCAQRGELSKFTEVAKNAEKDAFRGFKVIQGHRVWH